MAQYIGYFNVAIIVIVVLLAFRVLRNEAVKVPPNSDRMNFVVRPPRLYRVGGIGFSAAFGVFLVMTCADYQPDDPVSPFGVCLFSALFALSLFVVYYSYRWRLKISDDKLLYTPLFGQERRYSVRDVSHIAAGVFGGIKLYSDGEKLFLVDTSSTGCAMFVSYLIEKGVHVPENVSLYLYREWL